MNLVDLIKNLLSGELLEKLSALIGEGEDKTKAAADAAIPAILAGLSGLASSPGGAEKVVNTLRSPEVGSLDSVTDSLTRGDTGALVEKGMGWLSSLLGGGGLLGLLGALAKATGLDEGAIKKLLGALLPLVMGAISGQLKGKGLPIDISSLGKLFSEQQSNITNALPSGLSLASIPGAEAAKSAGDQIYKLVLPVLGVAAAALLAINFFKQQGQQEVKDPANDSPAKVVSSDDPAAKLPSAASPEAMAVTKSLGLLTETLGGIKDVPTAEAAAPKLAEIGTHLDTVKEAVAKLTGTSKEAVTAAIKAGLEKIQELAAKALAIPGVGEKLKPTVDAILAKLNDLTV